MSSFLLLTECCLIFSLLHYISYSIYRHIFFESSPACHLIIAPSILLHDPFPISLSPIRSPSSLNTIKEQRASGEGVSPNGKMTFSTFQLVCGVLSPPLHDSFATCIIGGCHFVAFCAHSFSFLHSHHIAIIFPLCFSPVPARDRFAHESWEEH